MERARHTPPKPPRPPRGRALPGRGEPLKLPASPCQAVGEGCVIGVVENVPLGREHRAENGEQPDRAVAGGSHCALAHGLPSTVFAVHHPTQPGALFPFAVARTYQTPAGIEAVTTNE